MPKRNRAANHHPQEWTQFKGILVPWLNITVSYLRSDRVKVKNAEKRRKHEEYLEIRAINKRSKYGLTSAQN